MMCQMMASPLYGKSLDLLPTIRSEDEYTLLARHDEADLLAARHQALAEGLTVDPEVWQQLKGFAAKTLVEHLRDLALCGAGRMNGTVGLAVKIRVAPKHRVVVVARQHRDSSIAGAD